MKEGMFKDGSERFRANMITEELRNMEEPNLSKKTNNNDEILSVLMGNSDEINLSRESQKTLNDLKKSIDSLNQTLEAAQKGDKETIPSRKETWGGKKSEKREKGAVGVIADLFFYTGIIVLLVFAIAFAGSNLNRTIFGYRFFTVQTTSMQSVYPAGSIIMVKDIDPNDIVIGNDITFYQSDNTITTHRVIDIIESYEEGGMREFQTKGVENSMPEQEIVYANNVIGVVENSLPYVGGVLTAIANNLIITFIIFGVLMAISFVLPHLFPKKKKSASANFNNY